MVKHIARTGSLPVWLPLLVGLALALAFSGKTAWAADPSRATTTFEKRLFWWGSEAFRHDGWILDSDLSADGRFLATASSNSFVVWELPSGKRLLRVQESDGVSGIGRERISVVRLSPDGSQLATVNRTTGAVCLWGIVTGKLQTMIAWDGDTEKTALEKAGTKGFERQKHSPDHYLAIEYLDNTRLRVQSSYFTTTWDTVKFNRVSTEFHPRATDYGITRDRTRVLRSRQPVGNGGAHSALLLWDVKTEKAVREFRLDEEAYDTVATLSDNQRYLAVTRKSGTEIAIWDWQDNKEVGVLLGFAPPRTPDRIWTMEFSPDRKSLYIGTSSGNLLVYDLSTKAKVRSWKACANFLMRMHFSPDGKSLHTVGGDGLARTWRLPDGKEVPIPDGYVGRPVHAWSRARNAMAVGDEQGRIDLWDSTGDRVTRTLQTKGEPVVQLAFSRSGRRLAASDGQGWIRLWDMETGDMLAKFGGTDQSSSWLYNVLQISDDETKLLVRTGQSVRMYRIPAGKELWLAPPGQTALFTLSPDGKTVCASRFDSNSVALCDADTFRRSAELEQPKELEGTAHEMRFTFSPDSRVLALASANGRVSFFDGVTGARLKTQVTEDENILSLGYSDDGTFLIAINHSKAFLFDAIKFERAAQSPFDVATYWRYRSATPGGVEKLLTLFRPAVLPKVGLEACWKQLDTGSPKEALDAMWQLSDATDAGTFLRKKIAPVAAADAQAIRQLIRDLDSPRFAVREEAARKLAEAGQPAGPLLRQALKTGQPAEAAERIERILASQARALTPEEIRQRRVIFALETNGSADARRTLETWAAGAPGGHLTEQAAQALGRMKPYPP
ncbi:WD40 repeat domain-containing protein [Zavarzinella formosa]|uniref:WD40 repeat domain-containing protein n=1 Tax=Zavarzinella formosa TaxID=360055 RepID=UPI0002DF294D|nr:WD40 repeat domain-containing protein [Zavarzinella formosa]